MIVGLGNPGKEYEKTRHNIGYMVIDNYLGEVKWKSKYNSLIYKKDDVIFVKPTTFMNLSGTTIRKLVDYYKIDIGDLLIVCDDLDLEIGYYKIKTDSSSGGHNGLKSIIENLGTKKFNRLKIGISNNRDLDTKDYVLGKFSKNDLEIIEKLYVSFNSIINLFIEYGIEKTLNNYKNI